jgi:hypothetical protein
VKHHYDTPLEPLGETPYDIFIAPPEYSEGIKYYKFK